MITTKITIHELPDGSVKTTAEAQGDPATTAEVAMFQRINSAVVAVLLERSSAPSSPSVSPSSFTDS